MFKDDQPSLMLCFTRSNAATGSSAGLMAARPRPLGALWLPARWPAL